MTTTIVNIEEIIEAFGFKGTYLGLEQNNEGHINSTYILIFNTGEKNTVRILLQKINTFVFKNPDKLMENIVGVTTYLKNYIKKRGGNVSREVLSVIYTPNGKPYYTDSEGNCWRCYNYIDNAFTYQSIDNPATFYKAGKAFGAFQGMLAEYPIDTLHDTIPDFHNTPSRYQALADAVKNDISGRAAAVREDIEFSLGRKEDTEYLIKLLDEGKLPLRVTHNDTKLNNVLFDENSGEGLCIVDLDTVMPGLSLYDFGDSIRFGANTADEDEKDVRKVSLNMVLYEQYVRGYLSEAGKSLNMCEIENLAFSSKLLTLECGMRFLTDYLNGDVYFKTMYDNHNLVRCRTQFALVKDIESKLSKMNDLTVNIYRELCL